MSLQLNGDTGVSAVQDGSIVAADFAASLFAASITQNGYQKLPSGLIIQWGVISPKVVGANTQKNFNIPFPTAGLAVFMQTTTDAASYTDVVYASVVDATKFQYSANAASSAYWIAIGY